ncbi:spore coat protein F [Clostridium tetani]|uniref:Spore coat protein n=1 Tax=Clostridium tetani TaxID=1513 RepID=A0ABC8E8R3_CLOTA|nr:spore coat protein [Clostridium tetani]CDI48398.1 spore coat protein [Clostridium tetani 12124569]AVP55519.1 spore coat protein [Clostridium tetani]KGI37363.1 spore coat protein F [Clostridium tetani ATCC 9441]KGI40769.1 spore coat protein F [Clostridium tetani]KGI42225.1 spore coat protein F [Clostridium tetani]
MNNSPNLSEKDLMEDLLTTEKQIVSSYSTGITESSCQNLRSVLVNNFKKAEDTQYKVFDAMKQRGWYQTKDAPTNEVQQIKDKSVQMSQELK